MMSSGVSCPDEPATDRDISTQLHGDIQQLYTFLHKKASRAEMHALPRTPAQKAPRRGNTAYDESDKSEISYVEADVTNSVDETGMAADSNARGEERHGRLEENVEKQDEGGNAPDSIQEDVAEGNATEQVELVDVIADVPETIGEGRHGRIEEDVEKQDEGGTPPILFKRMSQRGVIGTQIHVDVTAGVEEDVVRMDSGQDLKTKLHTHLNRPQTMRVLILEKKPALDSPTVHRPSPTPSVRSENPVQKENVMKIVCGDKHL